MFQQLFDGGQNVAVLVRCAGLQRKPFVQHQGFVLEQGMEACQRRGCMVAAAADQGRQRVEAVGHVACVLEPLECLAGPDSVAAVARREAEVDQRHASQRTATGGQRVGPVGTGVLVVVKSPGPVGLQRVGQLAAHGFAHGVDTLRVHHVELLCDVAFGRQGQHQFLECSVQRGVAQNAAHGLNICTI